MIANINTTLPSFALAGPVFNTTTTTTTFSPKTGFPPNYRPNKAELEAVLFPAHIRAFQRRLRQNLGPRLPSIMAAPQRTTRAASFSVPRAAQVAALGSITTTTLLLQPTPQAFP